MVYSTIMRIVDKKNYASNKDNTNCFEPMFGQDISGHRMPAYYRLKDDEIRRILQEAETIGIPTEYLRFNDPDARGTSYNPFDDIIDIKGNIFPDKNSPHPRDVMSVKAVLAHEFYGHRPYKEQYLEEFERGLSKETWNDEFRASYRAALDSPGLSDGERRSLILDAIERASEAQIAIKYNNIMRQMVYGY